MFLDPGFNADEAGAVHGKFSSCTELHLFSIIHKYYYIYNNWTNFSPTVAEMLCRVTSSWVCCDVLLSATEHGCWLSTKQWQSRV